MKAVFGQKILVPVIVCVLALAMSSVPGMAYADTLYVGPGESYTDIQSALTAAAGGDTIIVRDGLYVGVGNKDLDFGGKDVILRSENGPTNCIIDCEGSGRGFYFSGGETSSAVVEGFTIMNGDVTGYAVTSGGAIYCENSSSPTIKKSIISTNTAQNGGGIACKDTSSPTIISCTFSTNSASGKGGAFYFKKDSVSVITNCIMWNDTAVGGGAEVSIRGNTFLTISYSDVQGGAGAIDISKKAVLTWGPGNIDVDPLFVDVADYHLDSCSPAIDTGDPLSDYSNEPLPNGGIINIGAYGNTIEATDSGDQIDDDGDTYTECQGDCDDTDADVNPDATEICNGIDDDCNDLVDDDDPGCTGQPTWYEDFDGDGYGNAAVILVQCIQPAGYVADDTDCDDTDANNYPGNTEICDGQDNDCDSLVDDDDPDCTGQPIWHEDSDGDGYGNAAVTLAKCIQPAGYVADGTDCDDTNANVNPAATEICNGIDDDCDSLPDDLDPDCAGQPVWYEDSDGDGYGNAAVSLAKCIQPAGYVADSTDCDDTEANVNPAATEICNGIDDDCDTLMDDDDSDCTGQPVWYEDSDGDGYGNAAVSLAMCVQPAGYVADDTDCDDGEAAANPAAIEICDDLIDNDCDGLTDQDDSDCVPKTYYVPDDFTTIQDALDASYSRDTIIVRDGTHTGADNKNLDFAGKAILLQSENGAAGCIIDCENSGRAFIFDDGEGTDTIVDGFTIINGAATGSYPDNLGGGIYCYNSSPTIMNCTISGSSASDGGGIYCENGSTPDIAYCTIASNAVDNNGGGVACNASDPSVANCTISGNSAPANGGGIYCENGSVPAITNCLIVSNSVDTNGGGVAGDSSDPAIANCTISGNSAPGNGGGIYCSQSSLGIVNGILWDNSGASGPEIAITNSSSLAVYFSDVEGGEAAVHVDGTSVVDWDIENIDEDPDFVDAASGDYHLIKDSPCVDTGDPFSDYVNELPPNGNRIDMGAYGNTPEALWSSRINQFFHWVPNFGGGTSAPELARGGINYGNDRVMTEIKDSSSSVMIQRVFYTINFVPVSQVVLPNFVGTAAPEMAMLGRRTSDGCNMADVRDGASDAEIKRVYFHAEFLPYDMECVSNFGLTSAPELVTLARRPSDGAIMGAKRDASSRFLLGSRTWFAATFLPVDIEVVGNFGGTSAPELVVLGQRMGNRAMAAEVKDASSNVLLQRVWFDSTYWPVDIEVVDDFADSSAPELVMLGHRVSDDSVIGEVKDASTGMVISTLGFSSEYTPVDIEVVNDFADSSAPELVMLGYRESDGAVIGQIKDASTDTFIGNVSFSSSHRPKGIEVLQTFGGTSAPELAVHGVNLIDGAVIGEIKDASTSALLKSCTFSAYFVIP